MVNESEWGQGFPVFACFKNEFHRFLWKPHIDLVRRKTLQRFSILSPVLNSRSSLSIVNGVLLYKQLIRPMMDYACPVWRHVAPSHLKSLQVIQCKCLRSATGAPWYVSNLQIHSDLGFPYLAEHFRSIAQSIYSTENPRVRQLGRYLAYSRDVWKFVKICTWIQNYISAFSPDGVIPNRGSLQLKRSQLLGSQPRSLKAK